MSKITKALSFITAGVISLSMAVPCAASYDKDITVDPLFVYGDVNNDGACNSRDLVRIMKYMAGGSYEIASYADLNSDMRVNAKDLVRLMKVIAKTVDIPEIGNPFSDFADENLMNVLPDSMSDTPVTDDTATEVFTAADKAFEDAASVSARSEFNVNISLGEESISANGYISADINRDENGEADEAEIYAYINFPEIGDYLVSLMLRDEYVYFTLHTDLINQTLSVSKPYFERLLNDDDAVDADKVSEYISAAVYSFENENGSGYNAVYKANLDKVNALILQFIETELGELIQVQNPSDLFKLSAFEFSVAASSDGNYIGGTFNGGFEINMSDESGDLNIAVTSDAKFILSTSDEKVEFGKTYNLYDVVCVDDLIIYMDLSSLYDENGNPVENFDELYTEFCEVYGQNVVDEFISSVVV